MSNDEKTVKGRGSQINMANPFLKDEFGHFESEAIDEWEEGKVRTKYVEENPRKIINKVYSPDLGFDYSMNPYQGCEHGCVYCYARNTHHYMPPAGLSLSSCCLCQPPWPGPAAVPRRKGSLSRFS